MRSQKILIVDDEPDIIELVSYNLEKEGFRVSAALDGEEALDTIRAGSVDLVILDRMLPGLQGTELCRILRNDQKTRDIPILMLTAKVEEADKVHGLEIGADDYVTKPFSPRELVARVKALLRRTGGMPGEQKTLTIGNITISRETYTVTKGTAPLNLSATEFNLLAFLVERKGRVFSRDQLLDAVWNNEAFVEPRTVDVHIRRLRARIEDDPSHPQYLMTRRGVGYYVNGDL